MMAFRKKPVEKEEAESEKKDYGSGRMSAYGYVVEWRIKPESAAIGDFFGWDFAQAERWTKAPYSIEQLGRHSAAVAEKLIRPCIRRDDECIGDHGLVRRDVAEAVLASLKTMLDRKQLPHLEWRIARIEVTSSYSLIRSEENHEAEERSNELNDMLARNR